MQTKNNWWSLVLAAMGFVWGAQTACADEIFLQIDGVKGGSAKWEMAREAIDIAGYSWGVSNSISMESYASGRLADSRATLSELNLTMTIDRSTAVLFKHAITVKPFPKARLLLVRNLTDKAPYLEFLMENVVVASISMGGSEDADPMVLSLSLAFERCAFKHNILDPKTGSYVGAEQWQYDLAAARIQ